MMEQASTNWRHLAFFQFKSIVRKGSDQYTGTKPSLIWRAATLPAIWRMPMTRPLTELRTTAACCGSTTNILGASTAPERKLQHPTSHR